MHPVPLARRLGKVLAGEGEIGGLDGKAKSETLAVDARMHSGIPMRLLVAGGKRVRVVGPVCVNGNVGSGV